MKNEQTQQEKNAIHNGLQKVPYVDGDVWSGITKREYFAGLAMQGLISNQGINLHNQPRIVSEAVKYADMLLLELENTRP